MDRSIRLGFRFLLAAALAALPIISFAQGETLSLQRTAPYGKDLAVPSAIRFDCQLDTKIIDYIESFAGESFDKVVLVDNGEAVTAGKSLAVSITDLSGAGGGVWSGPKHLAIEGTLWLDGKIIGTFTGRRVTSGGALGAYKGTCSLLARCARSLGKDVAVWLKSPSLGAKLGEFQ